MMTTDAAKATTDAVGQGSGSSRPTIGDERYL
jgi:hypothetical protein